jgi:hypothetical protein
MNEGDCKHLLCEKLKMLRETQQTGNRAIAKKYGVSDSCIHYKIGVIDRLFASKKQNFQW